MDWACAAPLLSRTVIGFSIVWGVGNYVLAVFGLTPGAFGVPVAWQAHLCGYLAGLLAIGLFVRPPGGPGTSITH